MKRRRGGKRKGAGAPLNYYRAKRTEAVEKLCAKLETTVEDAAEVVSLAALEGSAPLEPLYVASGPDSYERRMIRNIARFGKRTYWSSTPMPDWSGGEAVDRSTPESILIAKEQQRKDEENDQVADTWQGRNEVGPRSRGDDAADRLVQSIAAQRRAVSTSRRKPKKGGQLAVPDLAEQIQELTCICDRRIQAHWHCNCCNTAVLSGEFLVYAEKLSCEIGGGLATVPTAHEEATVLCRQCFEGHGGMADEVDGTLSVERGGSEGIVVRLLEKMSPTGR